MKYQKEQVEQEQSQISPKAVAYCSFIDFQSRIQQLSLPLEWEFEIKPSMVAIKMKDDMYVVPKYVIIVSESLGFALRVFLWRLPSDHSILKTIVNLFIIYFYQNLYRPLNLTRSAHALLLLNLVRLKRVIRLKRVMYIILCQKILHLM